MAHELTIGGALRRWWRENRARRGWWGAVRALAREAAEFARDSTPERRRGRYGDIDYDWDYRVDTTAANLGWRTRLVGALVGPGYQPCDPNLFHATMAMLGDVRGFTFVDIGSGKGRALLLASDYPFRRIVGVELLPELHAAAVRNLREYRSEGQQCRRIEAVCGDAAGFAFPEEPLVVFLFNPLPEPALERLVWRLEAHPQPLWVVYHNPVLEHVLARLTRVAGDAQYAIYRAG